MLANLAILVFALSPLPGLIAGGSWLWLAPVLALVVFPLLDHLLPRVRAAATLGRPSPLLFLYLPFHAFLILFGAARVASLPAASPELWLTAFSVGIVTGGIGITFAHEWVHHLKPRERLLGEWLLVWVAYGHYATEHVYGHHKNVGLREDGATARKNEWIQTYIPRALYQVWRSAFRLKPARTLAHGLATLAIAAGIALAFGRSGLLFFFAQAAVAVLLLTSIDYIEHYGLERKRSADGRAEAVKPHHSWDSDTRLMGEVLIRLQRHADHHMRPLKPYPELALLAGAPRLPTGYAGMIWLAWWPHAWFRVMNPRLARTPLVPFGPNTWSTSVGLEGSAERAKGGVRLRFGLRVADPALLYALVPEAGPSSERRDELWRTTCFEAFFGVAGSPAYFEFNAAPSGAWAWYAFDDYRKGMAKPVLDSNAEPRLLSFTRREESLEAVWFIPDAAFGGRTIDAVSPTAVLDRAGEIGYWAAKHAGVEPDFHRRDSFVVRLG